MSATHYLAQGVACALAALVHTTGWAQAPGITTQGATGGLVVPTADVLPQGNFAVSYGNYQEPQLGLYPTHQNMSLGLGLLPYLELFGRYTNYVNPPPAGSIMVNGIRDLSANLKLQLPVPWQQGPLLALGVNDVAGGAVNFSARYMVATQQLGPVSASLGYAKSGSSRNTFQGTFGGVAVRLGDTGLSALAEHDGQQKHAGLRWQSPAISALGNAQWLGTVQRSFGAVTPAGLEADSTRLALSLVLPIGDNQNRLADYQPSANQALPPLEPPLEPPHTAPTLRPTPEDQLAALRKALIATGLERVRVGSVTGPLGPQLVIEYENHRYAHNETDALGVVLGLAAEMAPAGTQRIEATALKDGLRVHQTAVGVEEFRAFLRDAAPTHVHDTLVHDRAPASPSPDTRWIDPQASPASRVRLELRPDFKYTIGTEVGSFDYALAAQLQASISTWTGAQVLASYVAPLAHSDNMSPGHIFDVLLQRPGLKTLALRQTFWVGQNLLASVAAGRFHYQTLGVQAEAAAFLPGTEHRVNLRGAAYNEDPGNLEGQHRAWAATYRHTLSPTMWLEAGLQRYTDGSQGPSLEWNRWFGDVGVQLYYRKGADRQFAGLQLTLPLTPRQGMAPGAVVLAGPSQYAQSLRTRITTASQPANLVQPTLVRPLQLESSLDNDLLNAGRMSQGYLKQQAPRLREAFFTFARELLPESTHRLGKAKQ